jgi:hypothetical protein
MIIICARRGQMWPWSSSLWEGDRCDHDRHLCEKGPPWPWSSCVSRGQIWLIFICVRRGSNLHNKNMVKYIHNQQINIKSYINIFHR